MYRNLLSSIISRSRHSLNIIKVDLKFKQKPWEINMKDFILCSVAKTMPIVWIVWNILSCSIAPASSNLFSLKPANHAFISCIFLFSLRLSHSVLKSTSTAQAQLPVIYVLIFQKLVKFCYKINNLPPIPSFCFSSQVVDIIQKRSDFPLFCPMVWPPDFATLLWHCFKKNITC